MPYDPTDIPPEPTLCEDCREAISEGGYTHCTGCCPHAGSIYPLLGFADDPARDDPTNGTCADCGADVHIENDGDHYLWVTS